jgi:hypothetical protein
MESFFAVLEDGEVDRQDTAVANRTDADWMLDTKLY